MVDARSVGGALRGPVLILAAVALGLLVPAPDALGVTTTPLVAFLVFGAVRGHDAAVLRAEGRLRFAAAAVGAVYLLPVVFAPVPAVLLDGGAVVGVLVAAASPPTAGSAIVWTGRADGDDVATAVVVVAAIALAPAATPAILAAVLGRGVAVDPLPIVYELLLVVGGGLVLARAVPEGAVDESTLDRLSLGAVGALIYVGTATTAVEDVTPGALAAVGLLAVGFLALAAGVSVGCLPLVGRRRVVSLFFSSGLRNLGVAVAVATTLPAEGAVVVVVAFYVTQQIVAAVAAAGLPDRSASSVDRSPSPDG